ncbi:MAG TPA: enoyl-CoA hydratase [Burkholderiales bacterium]|nr:enoyl-CoA hydratase [Burkholderiales bacterium]
MSVRCEFEARGEAQVARLTIDNPKKLNILGREALGGIVDAMRAIERNDQVRAVVVTGAGEKAFIGGARIEELAALDPASAREFITLVHDACAAMRDYPLPVIARVNGYCIGAGLELAAACDFRIASANASFSMPEVRLAIPSVVEAALLARLIGTGRARWLVLTGEAIDAGEALDWGLVERVVAPEALDAAVDAALDAILASNADVLRSQKRLCRMWEEAPLDASIRASIDEFSRAYESGAPARAIAQFQAARRKR